MERSLELVVALIGVLKAGAAYLPIDRDLPDERIRFMLHDAGAALMLVADVAPADPKRFDVPLMALECADELQPYRPPVSRHHVENSIAYVPYTSGSTGQPKGVAISHRSLVNHMVWMQSRFPLDAEDRVLQKTPIGFDASVWEFFAPLLAGAQLVMAAPGSHRMPDELGDVIRAQGITVLQLVPTMLDAMLDAGALDGCSSLKRLYCGGEVLKVDSVHRFRAVSRAEVVNLYGPTETTIDVASHVCTEEDGAARHGTRVPIGRPIANVRLYVLDGYREPVPIGVTGELFVSGDAVAAGYWNRPELDAERFVVDPFTGARMFRTGDLVRLRGDGALEFVGRADAQVKLHGQRIELEEIEAVLQTHPMVRQAAAVVRHCGGGDVIVGYVVARESGQAHVATLGTWLRERLPRTWYQRYSRRCRSSH